MHTRRAGGGGGGGVRGKTKGVILLGEKEKTHEKRKI